jgi:predicted chitinase
VDSQTLVRAMPGLPADRATELVDGCVEAMRLGGVTTVARAAMFLAQIGHESVSLRFKEEIGQGAGHPYPPYYGRGFIQLTWRSNYAAFGSWAHARGLVADPAVFVTDPDLVEQDRWAWLSAVYFWTDHNLNEYADDDDVRGATLVINGGTAGLEARRSRYFQCLQLGDALCPTPGPSEVLTMAQIDDIHAQLSGIQHALDLAIRGDKAPPGVPENRDPHDTHPANLTELYRRVARVETVVGRIAAKLGV